MIFLWLFAVQLWRSYLCLSLSRTESVLSSERFVPKRMRPACSTGKSSPTISRNAVGLTATSQPSILRDERSGLSPRIAGLGGPSVSLARLTPVYLRLLLLGFCNELQTVSQLSGVTRSRSCSRLTRSGGFTGGIPPPSRLCRLSAGSAAFAGNSCFPSSRSTSHLYCG